MRWLGSEGRRLVGGGVARFWGGGPLCVRRTIGLGMYFFFDFFGG